MRKLQFILISSIITCSTCFAQNAQNQLTRDLLSFSPLKSPNQQIIEQVVNSGVFIIKQSYELADSADNRFGLSGNKAFAVDYSLAIKIKNGFLISERTIHPWDFNPLYDQYRRKYKPKLFPTAFSEISEIARYDTITIVEDSLKSLFSGLLYTQESELFFGDGFSVGGNIGENEGWIVWFTKKKGVDFSKTTDLNLSIIRKVQKITPRDNDSYVYSLDSLTTAEEIIGGIFVIPEVVSVGHMELKLCGIACRIENGWILCCPFIKSKEIFEKEITGTSKESLSKVETSELTPNNNNDDICIIKSVKTNKK